MKKRIIALMVVAYVQGVFAASLNPTEQSIKNYISHHQAAQQQLLKQLVSINSGTTHISGVQRVGNIAEKQLRQLGFKIRWYHEPASMHRAPTLIAERKGSQGKRLLLIGHLDTVFPADSKFQLYQPHQHTAKGPGVLDDKGGLVVMLTALKAIQSAHALNHATITVVLTGDEEDSGKPTSISRKPLFEAAKHADVALDFEPSITLETASTSRRGITMWTIKTHGNESHSSTIFQKNVGDGAIFELSRILMDMLKELKGEKYLTFNPGLILGGTKIDFNAKTTEGTAFGKENVVAKMAMAKGDIRFVDSAQEKATEDKMRELLKRHLPGTEADITFQPGIPAMSPTQNNMELLQQYSAASMDLGLGKVTPLDPGVRGAGDISHIAALVPANLAGLGPVGLGTHSVVETIELDSLPIQTQRAALLIYRLISSSR